MRDLLKMKGETLVSSYLNKHRSGNNTVGSGSLGFFFNCSNRAVINGVLRKWWRFQYFWVFNSQINHFVAVIDNPKLCLKTTLLCKCLTFAARAIEGVKKITFHVQGAGLLIVLFRNFGVTFESVYGLKVNGIFHPSKYLLGPNNYHT